MRAMHARTDCKTACAHTGGVSPFSPSAANHAFSEYAFSMESCLWTSDGWGLARSGSLYASSPMRFSIARMRSCSPAAMPADPKISSISSSVRPFVSGTNHQIKRPPRNENAWKTSQQLVTADVAQSTNTYSEEHEGTEADVGEHGRRHLTNCARQVNFCLYLQPTCHMSSPMKLFIQLDEAAIETPFPRTDSGQISATKIHEQGPQE